KSQLLRRIFYDWSVFPFLNHHYPCSEGRRESESKYESFQWPLQSTCPFPDPCQKRLKWQTAEWGGFFCVPAQDYRASNPLKFQGPANGSHFLSFWIQAIVYTVLKNPPDGENPFYSSSPMEKSSFIPSSVIICVNCSSTFFSFS